MAFKGSEGPPTSLIWSLLPINSGHFALSTVEVDGHDVDSLTAALRDDSDGPMVVVAKTKKGQGVSFMEGLFEWHYLPLSQESYQQAIEELTRLCVTHSAALS